jgi:sulfoxide reductase heme-binding subunit YedZ
MVAAEQQALQVIWPWQDRKRGFSWLKAGTFALMFAPALWLLYQAGTKQFGPVPLGGMTYWSGLWATAILLVALAITPAMTLFRASRLIIVRRMIGVTALVYTIAHIIIYFALRFWDFAFIANEMVTRISLIVASLATIGLIALGATSLDAAVRWMGAKGWSGLHNTVYAFTALALLHYLLSPGEFPEQYLMCGMFFWLMVWRLLDRRGLGADVRALAVLAVACGLFTAFFEAGWAWAYRGYAPSGTLGLNFSLALGVSPAWQMLALGLLIAVVGLVRRALGFRAEAAHPKPDSLRAIDTVQPGR